MATCHCDGPPHEYSPRWCGKGKGDDGQPIARGLRERMEEAQRRMTFGQTRDPLWPPVPPPPRVPPPSQFPPLTPLTRHSRYPFTFDPGIFVDTEMEEARANLGRLIHEAIQAEFDGRESALREYAATFIPDGEGRHRA